MTAAVAYRSQTAPARSRSTTTRPKGRPELRVLDQAAVRRRLRRRQAVVASFFVVLIALFGVAYVHAMLVESQQDLDLLRARIAELQTDRAQLERSIDEASSPALIVDRANELGMVRAAEPAYLLAVAPVAPADGADGQLVGTAGDVALGETGDG